MASFVPDKDYSPAQLYQEKVKYNLAGQTRKEKEKSKRKIKPSEDLTNSLLLLCFCSFNTTCSQVVYNWPCSQVVYNWPQQSQFLPSSSKGPAQMLGTSELWPYPRPTWLLKAIKHQMGWKLTSAWVQISPWPFMSCVPWASYLCWHLWKIWVPKVLKRPWVNEWKHSKHNAWLMVNSQQNATTVNRHFWEYLHSFI